MVGESYLVLLAKELKFCICHNLSNARERELEMRSCLKLVGNREKRNHLHVLDHEVVVALHELGFLETVFGHQINFSVGESRFAYESIIERARFAGQEDDDAICSKETEGSGTGYPPSLRVLC